MKEDYLWDKTGEPDPEILQLEQLLGTLRYQPRPLDIPAGLAPTQQRTSLPRYLAIAATIAIMLLGVGLWFGLEKTRTGEVAEKNKPATNTAGTEQAVVPPNKASSPAPVPSPTVPSNKRNRHRLNPGALSNQLAGNRRPLLKTSELTPMERQEAEAAKEQLMLALRLASSKLNFAQKKVREINSENLVHNQHKTG